MPEWLRVRDEHGNEFDLSPEDRRVKKGVVTVVEDYPENKGLTAVVRPAKYRVDKAGEPAARKQTPPEAGTTQAGTSAKTKE